ncbi:MAG: hypothetical protein QXJ59_06440 [Thermofilaceae archaeon]
MGAGRVVEGGYPKRCVKVVYRVGRRWSGSVELEKKEDAGFCPSRSLAFLTVREERGEWVVTALVPEKAAEAVERVARKLGGYWSVEPALMEAVGQLRRALGVSEDEEPVYRLSFLYRKGKKVYLLDIKE